MDYNKNDLRWCAVQVRPRYELLVAAGLRAKGYAEFLPMYRVKKQWSDRNKETQVPLFAGYVFCRLNTQIPWAIVSTPGVIRIVGTRKEIAMIDDHEIEAIRIVATSGKNVEPCAYAGIGERVRITTGPMAGVEGVVTGYKNQRRLVLSVELIHSSISVEVDGSHMVVVGRAAIAPSTDQIWSIPSGQLSMARTAPIS